jgi:pilus assembly protein CpaD
MIGSARKDSLSMVRFKTSAALLMMGLSTAACMPVGEQGLTPVSNPSLYSLHQPVVQRTDYVLDIAASGGVSEPELARLDAWFQSLQLGYGDRLYVDGGGYADARSREDIARVAASYGLFLADGAPLTVGAAQPGSVRVIVSRSTASVPGCPVWEDPQIGQSSRTGTGYGCSVNGNLAQMIADPNDLVLGQAGSDRNGDTGAKAVGSYIKRTPSGASGAVKAEGN